MNQFYKSLSFKIAFVIIFTEIIVLFVVGLVYINQFSNAVDAHLESNARLPGELINSSLLSLASLGDEFTMNLLVQEELIDGLAVDKEGNVFASLNPAYTGINIEDITGINSELFDFIHPEQKIVKSQGFLVSVSPVFSPDEKIPRLYIYFKISTDRADAEKDNVKNTFFVGSLITVILTSGIIYISLRLAVFDRLKKLVKVLGEVESGNLQARSINTFQDDEIGVLQSQVNSMAVQLEEQVKTLEQGVVARTKDLELSNNELKAFTYTVSHDLRAPIRAILGFGDIFYEEYGKGMEEAAQGYLRNIRESAKRMDRLIVDMLNFSRIAYSNISTQRVDMSLLAEDIRDFLNQVNPNREVTFSIETGLETMGDVKLLRILLDNLLGNAWKYTKHKKNTIIKFGSVQIEGKEVFFIEDDGAGFDMAYENKLFQVFQRLHTESEFEGTGVGLATAQKIVNKHEGEIWAKSEIDKGTTFFFTLGLDK